jgi:hypothetical protein
VEGNFQKGFISIFFTKALRQVRRFDGLQRRKPQVIVDGKIKRRRNKFNIEYEEKITKKNGRQQQKHIPST